MERTMEEIGAFDAKNKLSALLDKVERGEEILITRRGRPVAKLVPATKSVDREKVRAAVKGIRELAKKMNLGPFNWEEWKRYRDEGRE
jgi:prevent-host-death family protein